MGSNMMRQAVPLVKTRLIDWNRDGEVGSKDSGASVVANQRSCFC